MPIPELSTSFKMDDLNFPTFHTTWELLLGYFRQSQLDEKDKEEHQNKREKRSLALKILANITVLDNH